jgi:hypothetical protein
LHRPRPQVRRVIELCETLSGLGGDLRLGAGLEVRAPLPWAQAAAVGPPAACAGPPSARRLWALAEAVPQESTPMSGTRSSR